MQFPIKVLALYTCYSSSFADIVFVQKKSFDWPDFNRIDADGNPKSTCSKNSTFNPYESCPQDQCYGDSLCCLSTGQCTGFDSSICASIKKCESGSCASADAAGFPIARGSQNPSSYHLSYRHDVEEEDGCTCERVNSSCTSGACWGKLQCTNTSARCGCTKQCDDGSTSAPVGDFCMMLSPYPTAFKFCGLPMQTPPAKCEPTSLPTLAPTPVPTPEPTPETTTTTTCSTYSGTSECILHGDPHLIGFDTSEAGPSSLARPIFYEVPVSSVSESLAFDGRPIYLDVGDYWLIKSELLSIQGRYVPSAAFKEGGAVVGAIAMSGPALDGKRFIVEPRNGNLTWDGHTLSFGAFKTEVSHGEVAVLNGEGEVHTERPFSQVVINLPMSIDLMINRYDTFLNVKITMPKSGFLSSANVEGQCGNSNGVEEDDTLPEIEQRMHGSAAVLPQHSLFG